MFHTIFLEPVYNIVVFFLNIIPSHDIGIAIIFTTLLIKLILLKINISSQRSSYLMKSVEIDINKIKEKYKGDNKKIAEATMALYKEKKIKPFASILGLIIQIPVFFALYFVFRDGVKLDNNLIYSFIKFPSHVQDLAFGFMNISQKYWILGVLTGISMFILAKRQSSLTGISKDNKSTDFKTVFAKNMQFQMTYFLPIFAGFSTAMFPAVIGIYWTVNNILSIFQDIYIKKQLRKEGLIK